MLSALIETHNCEKPLASTLSALVPAVVDGFLRRVTVIDRGSTDGTPLVAAGSGCTLRAAGELDAALTEMVTPWLLILKPGAAPQEGWEIAARRHCEAGGGPARFTAPEERALGPVRRTARKIFSAAPMLDAGLLLPLETARRLAAEGTALDDFPRRLKPARLDAVLLAAAV